jgi:hypothetical protein
MGHESRKNDTGALSNPCSNFLDLRSEEEKQIEREAYRGVSLGTDADDLVIELIAIGQNSDFVSDPGGIFNKNGQHKRAREIGATLNVMGGFKLMQAAYYRVTATLGPTRARSLEFAWAYIGDWLS